MALPLLLITTAAALVGQTVPNGSPLAQPPVEQLPQPTEDPLRIDLRADPILRLGRSSSSPAEFRALIEQAVERSPRVDEAEAGIAEAVAARGEARAGLFPSADISLNSQRSIVRNFEDDDPDNIVERARARGRTAPVFPVSPA